MFNIVFTELSKDLYDRLFYPQLVSFPASFEKKLLRFKNWQDSQASLFGRLLLKYSLWKFHSHILDYNSIRIDEYGKPWMPNSTFDFNISHSSNLVCCVTSVSNHIGIDLEKINDQINIEDFDFQLTAYETTKIYESNEKIKDFYRYWTQKEAVIKLIGKGLSIPLQSFEIRNNKTFIEQKLIHTKEIFIDERYICHIASEMNLTKAGFTIENVPNSKLR
jgi:4'-phosphopantetheinyl transferase